MSGGPESVHSNKFLLERSQNMKIMTKTLVSSLLALGLSAGIAFAQAPAAPATTPPAAGAAPAAGAKAPAAPSAAMKAPAKSVGVPKQATTPEGVECSKQADAKNLHGKERVKFRAKCKSDLKKAAKAAAGGSAPAAAPAAAKKN